MVVNNNNNENNNNKNNSLDSGIVSPPTRYRHAAETPNALVHDHITTRPESVRLTHHRTPSIRENLPSVIFHTGKTYVTHVSSVLILNKQKRPME